MSLVRTHLSCPAKLAPKVFFIIFAICAFLFIDMSLAASDDIASASQPPSQVALTSDIDVGVVFPFAKFDLDAKLTNISSRAVQVDKVSPRWAGTNAQVDFTPVIVSPGESIKIGLKIQNGDRAGRFSHIFLLFDDKQKEPVGKIAVRGFADWIVSPKSLNVDLATFHDSETLERVVHPEARPGSVVNMKNISIESDRFEAKIVENGKGLSVKNRPGMPWGVFDEMITVDTDSPIQKKVGIHLRGEVRGNIVPSMSVVEFGLVRVGVPSEQAIKLVDETGKKITIGKISIEGAPAVAKVEDCVPKLDSCRVVKLTLSETQMGNAPRGLMRISFPDYGSVLPIAFGGALVGKDTVVKDLEKEVAFSRTSSAGISAALKSSTTPIKAIEMPTPDGKGSLLKWEMANETSIFGYEIYRSGRSAGPFLRVNSDIIARLSDDQTIPSVYRWRDTSSKPGNTYWYYIGVVYLDGRKEALNSPQMIVAK